MPRRRQIIDNSAMVALALWAAVGSISLVLAGRAVAGAFDEPVSAVVPLLATAIMLCGSLAAWTLFHRDGLRGDIGRRLLDGLTSLFPAGLAGFTAAINAGPMTLAAVTCLMICGLSYVVAREGTRPVAVKAADSPPISDEDPPRSSSRSPDNEALSVVTTDVAPQQLRPEVPRCQQVTRRKQPDGSEQVEAVLLAAFVPGQRQVALHLPIQPVMRSQLDVECEPLEDASVSVHATFVSAYGVRLDVKRSEQVDDAAEFAIGVLVTAPVAAEAAA